jgi:signal transduction histidine kinase
VDLAERGREQERIEIAHELHDSLGHQLVALGLSLELAKNRSEGEVRKLVESAQSLSRQTLSDVKNLVHLMAQEQPVNLREALQQLARELPEPQVHIDWQRSAASECAPENTLLLRIVQEIVANSIQHARSRNIWIHAVDHPAQTELCVQDDGTGMENAGRGMGLSGIRMRVAALGGTLQLANRDPCGFEVRVSIPRAEQALS